MFGSNIFAGTDNSGVFFSTNNGTNWIQIGLNNQTVYSLLVSGSNIFAGTLGNGVYLTTNNGVNWIQTGLNNQSVYSLAVSGSCIFAGTAGNGVYLSMNNGSSWVQKNEGFSVVPTVNELLIANGYIFAGTNGQSVWRRPLSDLITEIQPEKNTNPKEYYLGQNYPNPFNAVTKIKFNIAGNTVEQTFVSVYNILGKEIAVLVNKKLNPGTYEVSFDAGDLPSGVYFYRLTAGKFTDTKKLIIIK
jgi:hypothetical protein